MPTVDLELGRLLGEELRRHHVQVVNDVTVKAIHHHAGGLTVAGEPDFAATADLVLVGVRPDTDLAVVAGRHGVHGYSGCLKSAAPELRQEWPRRRRLMSRRAPGRGGAVAARGSIRADRREQWGSVRPGDGSRDPR